MSSSQSPRENPHPAKRQKSVTISSCLSNVLYQKFILSQIKPQYFAYRCTGSIGFPEAWDGSSVTPVMLTSGHWMNSPVFSPV